MAYGYGLFLGFRYPEMLDVARQLGLTIKLQIEEEDDDYLMHIDAVKAFNRMLHETWLWAIRNGLGLKLQDHEGVWNVANGTSWQPVNPWGLRLEYDPDELGDDATQAVLGVNLIARYRPTFLDIACPHGGSDSIICLDEPFYQKIKIARSAITSVLPPWKDAMIIFKMIHY